MAKRFTDNEKWQDNWFTDLTNDQKIIWIYLLDHCDNAGLWKVNIKNLNYFCSTNISVEGVISIFKNRLTQVKEDLFLINKFCLFQYGPDFLNNNGNKAVKSAINKLIQVEVINEVNGIYTPTIDLTKTINRLSIPYTYTIDRVKEEEEDKNKVKVEDEGIDKFQLKEEVKVEVSNIDTLKKNKLNEQKIRICKQLIEEGQLTNEQILNLELSDVREMVSLSLDNDKWETEYLSGQYEFQRRLEDKNVWDYQIDALIKLYKLL